MNSDNLENKIVAVVGLGYVGLPLALAFSNHFRVIGFDIDIGKINNLQLQYQKDILFTADPEQLSSADFLIMCVPTPVTKSKDPDLSFVRSAAELVGYHIFFFCFYYRNDKFLGISFPGRILGYNNPHEVIMKFKCTIRYGI